MKTKEKMKRSMNKQSYVAIWIMEHSSEDMKIKGACMFWMQRRILNRMNAHSHCHVKPQFLNHVRGSFFRVEVSLIRELSIFVQTLVGWMRFFQSKSMFSYRKMHGTKQDFIELHEEISETCN